MMEINWLDLVIVLVMIAAFIIGVSYYFNIETDECASNPFVYGAKQMESRFGYEFYGTGLFIVPPNTRSPVVRFTSENMTIDYWLD